MNYVGVYSYQFRSRDFGGVDVCLRPRAEGRFTIDAVEDIS